MVYLERMVALIGITFFTVFQVADIESLIFGSFWIETYLQTSTYIRIYSTPLVCVEDNNYGVVLKGLGANCAQRFQK